MKTEQNMNMTHKIGKPVPVICSSCNNAVENVFILVGKTLHTIPDKLPRKIWDTYNMI